MLFRRYKIKRLTKKLQAMHHSRMHSQAKADLLAKEVSSYYKLGHIYHNLIGHKKYPFANIMELACLRAAAALEDINAQYATAKKLLDEAKFREQLEKNGLFANTSNARQMQLLYEETFSYLQNADKLGHALAKRLRGLCYINGWGVDIDKDKGFDLVVASIAQENSWDRIPQIFAAIGLNKPEFFAAIMQHRKIS